MERAVLNNDSCAPSPLLEQRQLDCMFMFSGKWDLSEQIDHPVAGHGERDPRDMRRVSLKGNLYEIERDLFGLIRGLISPVFSLSSSFLLAV